MFLGIFIFIHQIIKNFCEPNKTIRLDILVEDKTSKRTGNMAAWRSANCRKCNCIKVEKII